MRPIICFILIFLLSPSYAFRSVYIVPDGKREDALLNGYANVTPLEAALIASGIPEDQFIRLSAEYRRWENDIQNLIHPSATQYEIADTILNYIHARVFSRYQLNTTTLAEVFENGLFNCLSATVLNGLLLQDFGIEVKGVVLPTHVYLVAILDGIPTEIENTIPQGLLIAQDKNLQSQFNSLTGFNYGTGRKVVIAWSETIGILYSNRSYFNAKKGQPLQAFQNMMKAQTLLASAPSEQSNLTAGYLNYSYHIFRRDNRPSKDYLHTLEILQEGIKQYPQQEALKGNYTRGMGIILQRMITNGADDGEIDQFMTQSQPFILSKDFATLLKNRYPQQISYYLKTKKDLPAAKRVLETWYNLNPQGKDEQAWVRSYSYEFIQQDLKNNQELKPNVTVFQDLNVFPPEITQEMYGHYYSELARRLFNARNYESAVSTMEQGLKELGRQNYITENGFAMAVNSAVVHFNQNRYEDALAYYKRALAFKRTPQIIKDIATVYGNLAAQAYNNKKIALAKKWVREGLSTVPGDQRLREIQAKL